MDREANADLFRDGDHLAQESFEVVAHLIVAEALETRDAPRDRLARLSFRAAGKPSGCV